MLATLNRTYKCEVIKGEEKTPLLKETLPYFSLNPNPSVNSLDPRFYS
jgi:hypothetical protein